MPPTTVELSNNPAVTLSTYENSSRFAFPVIQIPINGTSSGATGTATFAFTGTSGLYDVSASYIDESDGVAGISLNVGGSIEFSNPAPGNTAVPNGPLATRVFILENQDIVLTGTRNLEEYARVGALTFTPVSIGTVSFGGATFSANEGEGPATVNLIREGSTEGEVSVTVNLADGAEPSATAGADYTASPIVVTFADGESTASAAIPLLDDSVVESDETVLLTLTSDNGNGFVGAVSQANLVIQDNDVEPSVTPTTPPVTPIPTTPPVTPAPTTPSVTPPVAPPPTTGGNEDDGDVLPDFVSVISGTGASETITGTAQDDVILARGGGDIVQGLRGNDEINGGDGRDLIFGGAGSDRILGGRARDFLNGDGGADFLSGGQARDVITGGSGNDIILGGAGRDVLSGNKGNDELLGGGGSDILRGNKGDDLMSGGNGRDVLRGGGGADIYCLEVARGVDLFEGFQKGTDIIDGGGLSFDDLSVTVRGGNSTIRVEETNQKLAIVIGVDVTDSANFA